MENFPRFQSVAAMLLSDSQGEAEVALKRFRRMAKDSNITGGDLRDMLMPVEEKREMQRQIETLTDALDTAMRSLQDREAQLIDRAHRRNARELRADNFRVAAMMLIGLFGFVCLIAYVLS